MQYVIDKYSPDLIVNLGTCGGFEGVVEQGEIILVDKTYVYDIVELMGDLDIVDLLRFIPGLELARRNLILILPDAA